MRIDSSGNLGLGVTPSTNWSGVSAIQLNTSGSISATGSYTVVQCGLVATSSSYSWKYLTSTYGLAYALNNNNGQHQWYGTNSSGTAGNTASPSQLMTLDSSGNLLVGVTNTTHGGANEISTATGGVNSFTTTNTNSSNPYGYYVKFTGANPNNTTNYFFDADSSTGQKAVIWSNGTFGSATSTYGGLSDVKLKQDIVDASSQWADIKAVRVRKYRFKSDPTGYLQIGVIAQELEQTSAGLVDESPDFKTDENGKRIQLDTTTKSVKYSILYMKAIKALQEAMIRIETLEAKVTALEAKLGV
jgi:hypothetical protein